MSSSYKTLNVSASPDGDVITVEFNRPEALNAMNTAMGEDLLRCFEALQWDKAVRVVVLTGSGTKAFCVGGDLKERQGMSDDIWRAQHVIFEAAAARVLHCPVPVIAAVKGDIDSRFSAGIDQSFARRIFADNPGNSRLR